MLDGLTEVETAALVELSYIGLDSISNLESALALTWVKDSVTTLEHDLLDQLSAALPPEVVADLLGMPFLQHPATADLLAIQGMNRLAQESALDGLTASAVFADGIADEDTVLVAAAASLYNDPPAIEQLLAPGSATVETMAAETSLSPDILVSVLRTGGDSHPETTDIIFEAVSFTEELMTTPLPTHHVVVVLHEAAVTEGAAGTNYGFAAGYLPEYEDPADPWTWHQFQMGLVHEVAHYYWRTNEGWVDEGMATFFEYIWGHGLGLSRGQLKPRRNNCEVPDLLALHGHNPAPGDAHYGCAYYLGSLLFIDLLEHLPLDAFLSGTRDLYQLALAAQADGQEAGIEEVRRAFGGDPGALAIIEHHWSAGLNAPENRPYDEGVDRIAHDLVRWDEYPTFDGNAVTFAVTLLEEAELGNHLAPEKGGAANFSIYEAGGSGEFAGSILPPLPAGWEWGALDPGYAVATDYPPDPSASSFTVTFPFPEALDEPTDYVVVVWGFQDDKRVPTINEHFDRLGYARIR